MAYNNNNEQMQLENVEFNLEDHQALPMQVEGIRTFNPAIVEECKTRSVHRSFVEEHGPVIWIYNTGCSYGSNSIGGLRLPEMPLHRIPKYLDEQYGSLKQHMVAQLQRHLVKNSSPLGMCEVLTAEDYGLTFTMGSLSPIAKNLCFNHRFEAPMFACLHPAWISKVAVAHVEGNVFEYAYVINAYISLLPAAGRRLEVLRKYNEVRKKEMEQESTGIPPHHGKTRRQDPRSQGPQRGHKRNYSTGAVNARKEFDNVHAKIDQNNRMVVAAINNQQNFPPMPVVPIVNWPPEDNLPTLPQPS